MNCRRAKAAINERALGRLSSGRAVELDAHLRQCAACSSVDRADRWIIDELASLRGQIPYRVDVRRRVMIEIDRLAPTDSQEVSPWQLGWATAVVGLGAVVLLGLLWSSWPEWRTGMENLVALIRGLADVSGTLAAIFVSMLAVPFKLIIGLRNLWAGIPSVALQLEPFAVVGVATCYLIMAGTIVRVVGRDLRQAPRTRTRED